MDFELSRSPSIMLGRNFIHSTEGINRIKDWPLLSKRQVCHQMAFRLEWKHWVFLGLQLATDPPCRFWDWPASIIVWAIPLNKPLPLKKNAYRNNPFIYLSSLGSDSCQSNENWLDSAYILKVKLTPLADQMDMRGLREKAIKNG